MIFSPNLNVFQTLFFLRISFISISTIAKFLYSFLSIWTELHLMLSNELCIAVLYFSLISCCIQSWYNEANVMVHFTLGRVYVLESFPRSKPDVVTRVASRMPVSSTPRRFQHKISITNYTQLLLLVSRFHNYLHSHSRIWDSSDFTVRYRDKTKLTLVKYVILSLKFSERIKHSEDFKSKTLCS